VTVVADDGRDVVVVLGTTAVVEVEAVVTTGAADVVGIGVDVLGRAVSALVLGAVTVALALVRREALAHPANVTIEVKATVKTNARRPDGRCRRSGIALPVTAMDG